MAVFRNAVALVIFHVSTILLVIEASLYNPHVYPKRGPFFEGWYARLIDEENEVSFGVLFGRVLRKNAIGAEAPTTYLGLLRSKGEGQAMKVAEAFPQEHDIEITVDGGQPVTKDPAFKGTANFKWCANPYGCFVVTPNATTWRFKVQNVIFKGSTHGPYAWSPDGEGPEGWVDRLPILPLHWFVYSLGSKIDSYSWVDLDSKELVQGNYGFLHQEKNWGVSFPAAWIWVQGLARGNGIAFAMSLGVLDILKINVPAHLIGYRNMASGNKLSYLPLNSYTTSTIDGCLGFVNVTVHSVLHKLEVYVQTSPKTLNKCLNGPTVQGFTPVCVESYTATAKIRVFRLSLTGYKMVEEAYLNNVALEFGGHYLCATRNPCKGL